MISNMAANKPVDPRRVKYEMALARHDLEMAIEAEAQDHFERTRNPEAIKPTQQTLERLRPDTIETMVKSGSLTVAQGMSAQDMTRCWTATLNPLRARISNMDGGGRGRSGPQDSTDREIARREHFDAWACHLDGQKKREAIVLRSSPLGADVVRVLPPLELIRPHFPGGVEFTFSIVFEGCSLDEASRKMGWRKEFSTDALKYALAWHADRSGYEDSSRMLNAFREKHARRLARMIRLWAGGQR